VGTEILQVQEGSVEIFWGSPERSEWLREQAGPVVFRLRHGMNGGKAYQRSVANPVRASPGNTHTFYEEPLQAVGGRIEAVGRASTLS